MLEADKNHFKMEQAKRHWNEAEKVRCKSAILNETINVHFIDNCFVT